MEHEDDGDTNCKWRVWNNPQKIDKETGRLVNRKTTRDRPNDSIFQIRQNTERSPGELRRLAITQTLGKNYQQTLV